jgi:TonB family protein
MHRTKPESRSWSLLAAALMLVLGGCASTGSPPVDGLQWLEGARPVYPAAARAEGIEGAVVVEYRVSAEGEVRDPRVVRAEPPGVFDQAALAAVRTWRYRPHRPDGEAVEVPGVRSTLRFRLGEAYEGL